MPVMRMPVADKYSGILVVVGMAAFATSLGLESRPLTLMAAVMVAIGFGLMLEAQAERRPHTFRQRYRDPSGTTEVAELQASWPKRPNSFEGIWEPLGGADYFTDPVFPGLRFTYIREEAQPPGPFLPLIVEVVWREPALPDLISLRGYVERRSFAVSVALGSDDRLYWFASAPHLWVDGLEFKEGIGLPVSGDPEIEGVLPLGAALPSRRSPLIGLDLLDGEGKDWNVSELGNLREVLVERRRELLSNLPHRHLVALPSPRLPPKVLTRADIERVREELKEELARGESEAQVREWMVDGGFSSNEISLILGA